MECMSIIRNSKGNMVGRVDTKHLRDNYGNCVGDIRGDKYGNYIGEFQGSHFYDAQGNRKANYAETPSTTPTETGNTP